MAELIPLEYRFELSRRMLVQRWIITGILVVAVAVSSLAYAYTWQRKQADQYNKRRDEYGAKSAFMAQARELQARRIELAARMQKMQELKDDKILLSLLRNVSEAFSPKDDCLEYISVMAHNTSRSATDADDHKYSVHITGITRSDTTHAELVNRLTEIGAKASLPMATTPESQRRENLLDGKVMRFQITCDKPEIKRG